MSDVSARVLFRITKAELESGLRLLDKIPAPAIKPLTDEEKIERDAILARGGFPVQIYSVTVPAMVQRRVNAHWRKLAEKYGFDHLTVQQPLECEPGTFLAVRA